MLVLVQVPLFWHGLRMSHGADEVLQFVPIVWPEQVGGTKDEGVAWAKKKKKEI